MDILKVEHLKKSFGERTILQDVSFKVREHSIYGFLGKNGAGKTTTMKLILGLLAKDSGDIEVMGESVLYGENKTNQYIGYLPDVPEFYGYMTPMRYLQLCGEITRMKKEEIISKSKEMLKLVGLSEENKRIDGFSRGMKQRLGIAQALLNEPKLLICDEPTSALDPIGRREILDILEQVREKTTVIFSTHILSDVEQICDEIAVLNNGEIVLSGDLEHLKQSHCQNNLHIVFSKEEEKDIFLQYEEINACVRKEEKADRIANSLVLEQKTDTWNTILRILKENEIQPIKMEQMEPTLENLFMGVVK